MRPGVWPVTSRPQRVTLPPMTGRMPATHSASSVWPLPSTPHTPTTSPARTVRSMPRSAGRPRSPSAHRPRMTRRSSPAACPPGRSPKSTSRPTISEAISRSLVSRVSMTFSSLPRRITPTRSLTRITSGRRCVMRMTVMFFSSTTRRMTSNSSSASCGVRTAVGSSRISTSAPVRSALRISTRCWMPTLRSRTTSPGSTFSPYSAESLRTVSSASCPS